MDDIPTRPRIYMSATAKNIGALGIFHAYAGEGELARALDANVRPLSEDFPANLLKSNELRYGWLHRRGDVVDEVMLARPTPGLRVLMTHGGVAVRKAVEGYFSDEGFSECSPDDLSADAAACRGDILCDMVLARCVTEAQAGAVLAERERAAGEGGPMRLPENLMRTHRIMLAGPPNAGKSSLLNCLAGYERAFVHAEAGATRDVVDEFLDIGGYAVLLGDSPGFFAADDELAAEAWTRAAARLRLAEQIWFVCDASRPWGGETAAAARETAALLADGEKGIGIVVVLNKSDLPPGFAGEPWRDIFPDARSLPVCSLPDGDARVRLEEFVAEMWRDD